MPIPIPLQVNVFWHPDDDPVLACNVLNRMTELGRPVSYRIGR